MKAIEQYFNVVLFIMPYKVVLTFKSVDKTLVWNARQLAPWTIRPRQLAPELQTRQWIKERRIISMAFSLCFIHLRSLLVR